MMKIVHSLTLHKTTGLLIGLLLWLVVPMAVHAATLSVSPNTGVHAIGSTFSARVVINTSGQSINAAEGTLSFDPSKLSVVGISKGSIFNLWTQEPTYSNGAGSISFGGGSPSGYSGSAGTVMTITFRTNGAGTGKLSFSNGSILAADGRGTNVLSSMNGGSYTITAQSSAPAPEVVEYVPQKNTPSTPRIDSSTHPDPDGWYQNTTAELSWSLPSGVTAVRTLLSNSQYGVPTKVYEPSISSLTLEELEPGVQYLHLQYRNADGWGGVAHYRLAIDTEKPSAFSISLPENADLSAPAQTLVVEATDELSGIGSYLVQIDGGEPYEWVPETASSTLTLPELAPGYHSVIVEAKDRAGNGRIETFSFTILAFDRPQFTEYPSEINEEVIPVIKGATRPNAEVTVRLARVGSSSASPGEYQVTSDQNGVFTFIPDGTLDQGVYEITATAIDQHGAQSEPSEAIRIVVQPPGYIAIGSLVVNVLSIVVPLVGLVLLLILGLTYFFRRIRTLRSGVATEAGEALAVLATEFDALEKTLTEQRTALEASRKSKKLTKAETNLVEALKTKLREARDRVREEIKDVDEIVE